MPSYAKSQIPAEGQSSALFRMEQREKTVLAVCRENACRRARKMRSRLLRNKIIVNVAECYGMTWFLFYFPASCCERCLHAQGDAPKRLLGKLQWHALTARGSRRGSICPCALRRCPPPARKPFSVWCRRSFPQAFPARQGCCRWTPRRLLCPPFCPS